MQSVKHQLRGSTPSVTKPKQQCTVVDSAFVFVILYCSHKLCVEKKTQTDGRFMRIVGILITDLIMYRGNQTYVFYLAFHFIGISWWEVC